MSTASRVLIYLLRRDLRLADNPIFHEIARVSAGTQPPFTHILPVYVFAADQIEVKGFLTSNTERSPYPEARSQVGRFWRCGKLRAKFLAESVWDLKADLEKIGSGLVVRVGTIPDVVRSVLDAYRQRNDTEVHGLWMSSEEAWEEKRDEREVRELLEREQREFRLWTDEKYFIDDCDLPFKDAQDLPDVFTAFRKSVEPLRERPRVQLPSPEKLPSLPEIIPGQAVPFAEPKGLDDATAALYKPLDINRQLSNFPEFPSNAESAHPFLGGSAAAHERLRHLIESGAMSAYKDTRNGLLGRDFSTKISAWLALGCITARQIHWAMIDFEEGKTELGQLAKGYGQGENKGTSSVRFELLWRDYMRLCTRKFGTRLFFLGGYREDNDATFNFISSPYSHSTRKKNRGGTNDIDTRTVVERFLTGRTGMGLIDASQRELFLTGWTSNRARQNVASFLAKHLKIDWRIGAEWYEMNLIDYDVSSNWGNWQYVAGVGNDPRGAARVFNPVKQAVDYDKNGDYVRTWVPELRGVGQSEDGSKGEESGTDNAQALMALCQAWRLPPAEKVRLGLNGVEWVENPLVRIDFTLNKRGGGGGGRGARRGRGDGGRGRGRGRHDSNTASRT